MVFSITMVTFRMTPIMNKFTDIVMHDGWFAPLPKTLTSLVKILWQNIVMDDWNLDEKSISKRQQFQNSKFIIPQNIYEEWQIMLGHISCWWHYTAVYNFYWERQSELVTVNIIFSVASFKLLFNLVLV